MTISVPLGELTIAGLLGGLLGGLIGAFINHWLASWRDRKKEFQDAGKNFREAFLEVEYLLSIRHPEHSKLYSGSPEEYQDVYSLLCKFHKHHYGALVRFEGYLSKSKKHKLKKLWDKYCCFDQSPKQKHTTYEDYKSSVDMEEQWSKRDLALDRIKKMFQYTR